MYKNQVLIHLYKESGNTLEVSVVEVHFQYEIHLLCLVYTWLLGCLAVDDPSAKPILSRKVRQMLRVKPGSSGLAGAAGAAGGFTFKL